MGVLNVTPDSFADARHGSMPAAAIDAALEMEAAGADIVDIGGESTRPGAERRSPQTKNCGASARARGLAGRLRDSISIDTYKAAVRERRMMKGAGIVNDISGLRYDAGAGAHRCRGAAPRWC